MRLSRSRCIPYTPYMVEKAHSHRNHARSKKWGNTSKANSLSPALRGLQVNARIPELNPSRSGTNLRRAAEINRLALHRDPGDMHDRGGVFRSAHHRRIRIERCQAASRREPE